MITRLEFPYDDIQLHVTSKVERDKRLTAVSKEEETVAFLEEMEPGSVFVDVGANTSVSKDRMAMNRPPRRANVRGPGRNLDRRSDMDKATAPCIECGVPFTVTRPGHKYCGPRCRNRAGSRRYSRRHNGKEPFRRSPRDWPGHNGREELAWAAGFFDGEGSTFVLNTHIERDGHTWDYLRISLSVSQAASQFELERFRAAVGLLGAIRESARPLRSSKMMYKFSVEGFETVQQVICLLWNWLCPVKREQARIAMGRFLQDWRSRR